METEKMHYIPFSKITLRPLFLGLILIQEFVLNNGDSFPVLYEKQTSKYYNSI